MEGGYMKDSVGECCMSTLPADWLKLLRRAVDAGLSAEQVEVVIGLSVGATELSRKFDVEELVLRSRCVLGSITNVKVVK